MPAATARNAAALRPAAKRFAPEGKTQRPSKDAFDVAKLGSKAPRYRASLFDMYKENCPRSAWRLALQR
jgi:hypothetical protein